ncbi:hypothetical protein KC852_01020 [Candidatus Nomurabacteria bacterium]|nr:hypothetical protein [Candidatus Nomurabacteria bacterium]
MTATQNIKRTFQTGVVESFEKLVFRKILSGNGFPKKTEEKKYYIPLAEKALYGIIVELQEEGICPEAFRPAHARQLWVNYFIESYI